MIEWSVVPSFEVDEVRGTLVVSGEIDLASVDRLVEAALAMPAREPLRLDVRGVSFIDSTGIRGLIRISAAKGEILLIGPQMPVRRVLDLVLLEASLPIRVVDEPGLQGS